MHFCIKLISESRRRTDKSIHADMQRMLYSGAMNRTLAVAVVVCVILFILAVLISPLVDIQPSALRAQQWLILITAMFSLAGLCVIRIMEVPATSDPVDRDKACKPLPRLADLTCCLLC